VQRHEVGQRDPAMVVFDRYAFDLSQFAGGPQAVKYSIRERYLWQLMFPDPKDQFYIEQPGQFRAELHDRVIAPFYPLAFVVIAFAYLGAPRTTRQSRTLSMLGAIGGVGLLRLIGFVSTVFGSNAAWMLWLQYIAIVAAFAGGYFVIRRGIILEPPVFLTNWIAALTERISQRFVTQQ
jgi:lipopolysaccharide export system permease protein